MLISGSDAALNTLNVSTAFTASGLIYPTVDGTSGQAIVTDGAGSLSFATIITGTGATTKLNQTVAATTWSFAHNLNEQYPVVAIYDSNDEVIVPEKIDAVDSNNLSIYFSSPVAGRAVAVVGGTTVSASLSQTASYVEYDNVVNKPTLISGSAQIATDISGSFTSLSSSIAGDLEDIIDGTTTVTSASHAEYAESSSFATNFNISLALTASGLLYPTTDGTAGQVITTDGAGNLSFLNVDNTRISIKNVSGGTIAKGTPLFITASGTAGNVAGVIPADAGNPNLMPAGVIAGETIADEAEGVGLLNGFIDGVDTSLFASGDEIFVAVGGGYTNIPPTGSIGGNIALVQKLGNVEKSHPSAGSGVIHGPGTTRSVPNINPGYTWVGNIDYVATAVSTSSLFVTSGSHALNADDAISASYSLTSSYVNTLNQNVDITGDLTVTGTVTAQEFHTEFISASILYESGSTKFGDTTDDIHSFTGSVFISGARFEAKVSWPDTSSQYHLFEPENFTVNDLESGSRTYGYNALGMEHYEEGSAYHNSILFHFWSSSNFTDPTNYGSELNFGPINTFFRIWPSGSDSTNGQNLGNISLSDLQDGTTRANIYGTEIQVGAFKGNTILLGNSGSYINIKGTNIDLSAPISSSTFISASYFIGDGSKLYNVTASIVEYANVVNKPTLISGSAQITDLTTYKQTVSGSSTYTISHNLSEEFPIVQTYASSSKSQIIPQDITSLNVNSVQIDFSSPFEGYVIIKK